MRPVSCGWIEVRDGIWPMYISQGLRVFVTQYARGDWRWTVYYGHFSTTKIAQGRASTSIAAKSAALAAA